jgi:S-DNA-T family DNA segregation ATPase FtsK/SpoIIIE
MRWVCGLVLLFIGLFAAAAVFFSYFCWREDQSGLPMSAADRAALSIEPKNFCGWAGARLGMWLVDRSFGLFGILIPVMIVLLGVRIIRQRPLLLNHSLLSLVFVMILGSFTLGFAFSDKLTIGSSTGMGGAFGVHTAELLHLHIGAVGTIILLLVGWILTGVFINRNFINTVNAAGNAVVDRSEKFVDRMVHSHAPMEYDDEDDYVSEPAEAADVAGHPADFSAASVRPEPVRPAAARTPDVVAGRTATATGVFCPVTDTAVTQSENTTTSHPESLSAYRQQQTVVRRSAASASRIEVDRPFFDEVPVSGEPPIEAVEPEPSDEPATEELFPETPLSAHASARVVMGRSGLVELERPSVAPQQNRLSRPMAMNGSAFVEVPNPDSDEPVPEELLEPQLEPDEPVVDDSFFVEEPIVRPAPEVPLEPEVPVVSQPIPEQSEIRSVVSGNVSDASEGVVVTVEANEARMVDANRITTEAYDPLKDLMNYRKPPVTLLEDYRSDSEVTDEEIFENKTKIEETLKYFGIPIQRIRATVGPTVTLYEIVQAQGVKISKIQGLQNDIAQSLKAESGIRIIAPIPGRGTIGIEVPNRHKQVVSMYSAIRSLRFQESKAMLPVVMGRTIQNENYLFDLAKMPHLLVAGATGMGKSVGLNAIITSLLYKMHPAQLKFVMIDPKMVEFSLYAKIERHFLAKMESEDEAIVTDPRKAVYTLNALCTEMDKRLELCKKAAVRNIVEYNEKFTSRRLNPMNGHHYLPYIVVIIDEFADLIMTAKEVEMPVTRLAQKARAVGIHLIIATQRPSVDVITGKIKANFPARIAFRVMQMIDSRTILDRPGADQLIGRGDMLISKDGELTRIQCALVDTPEVERIVDYIAKQQSYDSAYALPDYTPDAGEGAGMGSEEAAPQKYDVLFPEIAREAVSSQSISTSMIQRNYEVGFNRAGRIMMQLERAGIVGRQQGAKPREILIHDSLSLEAKLQELGLS